MSMSNLVREPEIWVSMCRRFPWVVEERGEFGDGLVHLDFAALRRGVEKAADSGGVSTASDILAFVEDLLEKVDTLHPEVVGALDISFLEDLYLAEPHQRDFAVPLLQPKSKARWKEVSDAYDRLSG